MAQTPDGFLWLATYEGLARFDGVQFDLFTPENTPVFRSDQTLSVYAARSGDLWVGSRDRWAYRLRDGEWSAFSLQEAFGGGHVDHWVGGFAEDANGTLWAVSTGPYLARFDGQAFVRFTDRLEEAWPLFAADADGALWSELRPGVVPSVTETSFGQGVVARLVGERFEPVADPLLVGFAPTQYGPLLHRLVGTETDLARDGRVRVDLADASGRLLTWIWHDGITERAMLVDRAGRAWVQLADAEGQNVLVVVRDGEELARFAPEGATWFEQVFEDRQGSVWTFAASTGLLQITEEPFRRYTTNDGVPRYAVRASRAADGDIIVSTQSWGDEVRIATIDGGQVETHTYRPNVIPDDGLASRVRNGKVAPGQVVEDAQGQRWAVAESYLLRLDEGRAEVVVKVSQWLLRVIEPDPADPGVLWLGDIRGGVYRVDTDARVVTDSLFLGPGRSPSDNYLLIRELYHAPDGRFWVASDVGLAELRPDGSLHPLSSLEGVSVRALAEGRGGVLWAATDEGLARIRGDEARMLTRENGLPSDDLTTIVLDRHGYLWLGSGRVLLRLRAAEASAALDGERSHVDVVTLPPSDGHLAPSSTVWGTARDDDGGLWIPSARGVTRVDPALYARQHARPPTVVPRGVTTEDGEAYAFGPELALPVGERTLTLSYTATDLLAPDHVRFRTRLDGHDAGWIDRGSERRAVYGGLEPGAYTLWVQAMNAGGVWSDPVAAPTFRVPARFYETAWFAVLCVLAVGLALTGTYRARVRQLRRREATLGALVDERTEALRTEKQKTEAQAEQLRELDAAKGRFFSNVSHELRTPLALLLGPLRDLRRGRFDVAPEARPLLDRAEANGRRLQRLVEDLLTLTQADGGALTLRRRRLDLVGFVRDRVSAFGSSPVAAGVEVTFEPPDGPVVVAADPAKIETVVYNLVGNAIKFTPVGGRIVVRVAPEPGGGARLAVADTGIGIAPGDLGHLFDRFYQADTEAARTGEGAGIGLALVREIVGLHGGTVSAESVLGEGTTITVRLPEGEADDVTAAAASREPGEPPSLAVRRDAGDGFADDPLHIHDDEDPADEDGALDARPLVLVVEDNDDLRAYLTTLLEAEYDIEVAADGAGGISAALALVPDLVVSDVMMPGVDGFTLLAALKGDVRTSHVPVALLTARADAEARLAGLAGGADAYLAKPFDGAEFEATVANLLANRARLRAAWAVAAPEAARLRGDGALGEPEPPGLAPAEVAFLDRVREVVEANVASAAFGTAALAEAVGMSPRQLRRKLSALTGETAAQAVRRVRLDRAAALLADGAHSVKEVAYDTGFSSTSGFRRAFGERYGVSPSAYGPGDGDGRQA